MSNKEEFYNKVGKLNVQGLKNFLENEEYTFDEFKKEYDSWKSEEERYKKRLDKLKTIENYEKGRAVRDV
jgi:hypothetical protein